MVPCCDGDLFARPVNRIDVSRRWLRAWMRKNRVQLALTLRMTVAAVAGLGLAQAFALPLPLWTVLTALIVTQMSIGRSLKTSIDYFVGTVGGTIYGAALALLIPHDSEWALLLVLVLAVAPVALVAALKRNLNAVPVSSIIVVLMPALAHAGPLDSAIYRVLEVGLGVVVGLVVAFLVLPAGGHRLARQEAARTLDLLAQALGRVLAGPLVAADIEALGQIYERIGQSLMEFSTSAAEGERERSARLSVEPDTQPLRRTLLRLRHGRGRNPDALRPLPGSGLPDRRWYQCDNSDGWCDWPRRQRPFEDLRHGLGGPPSGAVRGRAREGVRRGFDRDHGTAPRGFDARTDG